MNTAQTLVIAEAVKAIAMASKDIIFVMSVLSDRTTGDDLLSGLQKIAAGNAEISEVLKNKGAKVKIDAEPKLKK